MKINKIQIDLDKLPKNCIDCVFNQNKYCVLKIALEKQNTFVQNNRINIDKACPLIDRY